MGIPLGCTRFLMAKQLPDNRKAESRASSDARMGMSKIMNADTLQFCTGRNCPPRPIEIGPRLVLLYSGNYIFAFSVEAVQDCESRGVQHNRFPAGLAVRQE